jgi:hypothetical protein
VRPENARGVRARLNDGFRVVGYDPGKYGSIEEGGARLVMKKDLIDEPLPFIARRHAERFAEGRIPLVDNAERRGILAWRPLEVAIPVVVGDDVDRTAHGSIEEALRNGYIGTGILRPDETGREQSLFVFQQEDTPPVVDEFKQPDGQ